MNTRKLIKPSQRPDHIGRIKPKSQVLSQDPMTEPWSQDFQKAIVADYMIQGQSPKKRGKVFSPPQHNQDFQQTKMIETSYLSQNEIEKTTQYIGISAKIREQIKMVQKQEKTSYKFKETSKSVKSWVSRKKKFSQVSKGTFYVGRLKTRDRCVSSKTFQNADQIYKCQCGKQYLSYMGIYRHIKCKHLRKDELKSFQVKTSKNNITGQLIKEVILSNFTQKNKIGQWPSKESKQQIKTNQQNTKVTQQMFKGPQQRIKVSEENTQNQKNLVQFLSSTVSAIQRASLRSIKPQEQLALSHNIKQQQIKKCIKPAKINAKSQKTAKETNSLVISFQKYESLLEDYRKLFQKFLSYQEQTTNKLDKAKIQNDQLTRGNLIYKKKVEALEQKQKIYPEKAQNDQLDQSKSAKSAADINITGQTDKNQQDQQDVSNSKFQTSSSNSQQMSLSEQYNQLPEFTSSSMEPSCISSFSSSIFQVSSLGKIANKQSKNHQNSTGESQKNGNWILKGLCFDPEGQISHNLKNKSVLTKEELIKQENQSEQEEPDIQSQKLDDLSEEKIRPKSQETKVKSSNFKVSIDKIIV